MEVWIRKVTQVKEYLTDKCCFFCNISGRGRALSIHNIDVIIGLKYLIDYWTHCFYSHTRGHPVEKLNQAELTCEAVHHTQPRFTHRSPWQPGEIVICSSHLLEGISLSRLAGFWPSLFSARLETSNEKKRAEAVPRAVHRTDIQLVFLYRTMNGCEASFPIE